MEIGMNKKIIFLIAYFFCVHAIDDNQKVDEADIALARKSACFIKHSLGGCVLGRSKDQVKKLTTCDHDAWLTKNLDVYASVFCLYDGNKNMLGMPLVVSHLPDQEYRALCQNLFDTLKLSEIKPKAIYGEITMDKGKPVLSFYDESKLWIKDYSGINPAFCMTSKGKLELSQSGKQQVGNSLDISGLQSIENKTNGAFIPRRFSWDVLNLIG